MSVTDRLSTHCGHQESYYNSKSKKKLKDKNISNLPNSLTDQEIIDFFKEKE